MRIIGKEVAVKDKAGFALIAIWDLENIMTFVFSGFRFILHLAHHFASLSRSLCRYSAVKSIFLLTAHWPASSANCDLLVWWWLGFGMPLTWIRKSNGLRLEPCETPALG